MNQPHERAGPVATRVGSLPVLLGVVVVLAAGVAGWCLLAGGSSPVEAPTISHEPAREPVTPTDASPAAQAAQRQPFLAAGRSPMPTEGEVFTAPLPFAVIKPIQPAETPEGVVPWNMARYHLGHTITVEGRVVHTRDTGSVCFLNFVPEWSGQFYVILFRGALGGWPQRPEQYFLDKTIRVTGEVRMHGGSPQIQVHKSEQIKVVE